MIDQVTLTFKKHDADKNLFHKNTIAAIDMYDSDGHVVHISGPWSMFSQLLGSLFPLLERVAAENAADDQ